MKNLRLLIVVVLVVNCNIEKKHTTDYTTQYFEFHNNYWINLHHFLYQKASGSQLKKLKEDNLSFLEIGEADILTHLSVQEKSILNQTIQYYKDSLISKNLRRDLANLKFWFQQQSETETIIDTTFGKRYTEIINKASRFSENKLNLHGKYFTNKATVGFSGFYERILFRNYGYLNALEQQTISQPMRIGQVPILLLNQK